jgi:hypothetical protein
MRDRAGAISMIKKGALVDNEALSRRTRSKLLARYQKLKPDRYIGRGRKRGLVFFVGRCIVT